MPLQLITDSTADIPNTLIDQYNIKIIPLYVNFSDGKGNIETMRDGLDIGPDLFYRRLRESNLLPTTSQPTVQDFMKVYQEASTNGTQIVSVHISSLLSGTYNAAVQAKTQLKSTSEIEIVDSKLASMGLGLAVLAGAKAIKNGATLQKVVEDIKIAISQINIYFVVDTLEYLQKGGRIGKAQALLGSLISLKPILTMADGGLQPLERVRTRRKAVGRLVKLVEHAEDVSDICLIYNTTPEDVEYLKEQIVRLHPKSNIVTSKLGATLGVHVGPGLIGVAIRSSS